MAPTHVLVEFDDPERVPADPDLAWRQDAELARLGRIQGTDHGAPAGFPLDPASLAAGFVISVAAGMTTAAVLAGIRKLPEQNGPTPAVERETT